MRILQGLKLNDLADSVTLLEADTHAAHLCNSVVVVVELSASDDILEGDSQALGRLQARLGGGLGMRGQLLALLQLCCGSDHSIRLNLGASTNHNLQNGAA